MNSFITRQTAIQSIVIHIITAKPLLNRLTSLGLEKRNTEKVKAAK